MVSKKVSVSVSKIYGIKKSIGFKKFGIEKVSDSENTFEETRNHLKNIYIKGWRCLFLPIRKSSQKYQRVAVLFSADDRKSSQKYQGVVVLVSANPEILSKISRGGGACLKNEKGTKLMMMIRIIMMMMFSIQLKDEYYSNINRIRIRIRIYSVEK